MTTRAQAQEAQTLKQIMEALAKLTEEMKDGQNKMTEEMKDGQNKMTEEMKDGQNKMTEEINAVKNKMTEEMKDGQNKMTEEMKDGQNKMTEEIKAVKNEMTEEIKKGQEELKENITVIQDEMKKDLEFVKNVLDGKLSSMESRLDTVEQNFSKIEENIHKIDTMQEKFEAIESKTNEIEENLKMKIEEKFDQKAEEGFLKKLEEKFEKKIEEKFDQKTEESLLKKLEEKVEKKIKENYGRGGVIDNGAEVIEEKLTEVNQKFECLEEKIKSLPISETSNSEPGLNKTSIKPSTYDGKSSWHVYKTQFLIVAEANKWNAMTKAYHLVASLRGDAADILQTLSEEQRHNFETLSNALELRFGEKCLKEFSRLQLKSRFQKPGENLQELAADVERLSYLAYPDYPTDVRDNISLQHFTDGIRDGEIQRAVRLADVTELKSALAYALKFEAAQQASRRERHSVRTVSAEESEPFQKMQKNLEDLANEVRNLKTDRRRNIQCWNCGKDNHTRRNCPKLKNARNIEDQGN